MTSTIIGSGNLAYHLAHALFQANMTIDKIYGRNYDSGKLLAQSCNSNFEFVSEDIKTNSDFLFICTNDASIEEISEKIISSQSIIIHCSGACSISALNKHQNRAVIYPLQTFSKDIAIPFKTIPFFIQTSNEETYRKCKTLLENLNCSFQIVNEEQQKSIHCAAVFINNFSTHNSLIGLNILRENQINTNSFQAIIDTTFQKISAQFKHPEKDLQIQTGPAIREDEKTMASHLEFLSSQTEKTIELYKATSLSIQEFNEHKRKTQ